MQACIDQQQMTKPDLPTASGLVFGPTASSIQSFSNNHIKCSYKELIKL